MGEAAPTPREVLARINAVLVVAGLNDTIFSIRDCDSTLFLLLFKKARPPRTAERAPCFGAQCPPRSGRGDAPHIIARCMSLHPIPLCCSFLGVRQPPLSLVAIPPPPHPRLSVSSSPGGCRA
jgi:hypothetical protein